MPNQLDFKSRLEIITKRNRKQGKKKPGTPWTMEKKLEVVGQWLVIGNLRQVAAMTGVPYNTVRIWRSETWWPEIEGEIRQSQNIELDTKLSTIAEKSLEATLDRVENGDFIYDQKSGEVRRKPAALRDVHKVAVDLIDRREALRAGAKDRGEGTKASMEEQLKIIATQFAQWFEPKKQKLPMLGEVEDAVSKEWEEGLQEGVGVGEDPETESSPRQSGAEQSSTD